MSVVVSYQLYCDGCEGLLDDSASVVASGTKQRREARAKGWLTRQPGGLDFCPYCREDLRAATSRE